MIELVRNTKFRIKNYRLAVSIFGDKSYYYVKAPYNKELIAELKLMQGAKWMGFDETISQNFKKTWRVNRCSRNDFGFAFLEELQPYAKYNSDCPQLTRQNFIRPLYDHQMEMVSHAMHRKQCIFSCEMGTGKTLAAIEILERSGFQDWWFVGTKSSIISVVAEFGLWKAKFLPEFLTYEELKKRLKNWVPGAPPPKGVIFDESPKIKTPTAQRSQAAFYLSEAMRAEFGDNAFIVLMTGSPAPKSPADWYWQVETACPGFFAEGNIDKFKNRLAVIEKVTGLDNVSFPKLICWRDGDERFCNICGKEQDKIWHSDVCDPKHHGFEPLSNEVARLYQRMKGLVLVKFKKDCLDLPEKIYRQIHVKASDEVLRAAKLVLAGSKTAIEALTRMRELSDGFQYKESVIGKETCTFCQGSKIVTDENKNITACPMCSGTGDIKKYGRETIETDAPKLDRLMDELELFEEDQRIVIYAGFTGSIDRICKTIYLKHGWHTIRVDGRGWNTTLGLVTDHDMYRAFQDRNKYDRKIAFVAHPGSAGMGLTLTASPAIIYYSNDFNAESRIQSEDRIHRPGMDVNKGATIIDMIHLPSDTKVLENLKRKKELQNMTLGELRNELGTSLK